MSVIIVGSRQFKDEDHLEKLVVHAATEYEVNGYVEDFNGGEITDLEYDDLVRELKNRRPTSKAFQGTSPSTAKASGDVVVHDPPMTSIEKADGDYATKKKKYNDWILKVGPGEIAQSYKHDGVAVRVNYIKGKLVSAGKRPRDGVNGTDITHHIRNIEGVPKKLPLPLTLSLNGEIECRLPVFDKVNEMQESVGEEPFKNARNYTAGCLARDGAHETKNARLSVTFYSITGFDDWKDYYTTEVERAKWANSPDGLGLEIERDGKMKGVFVHMRKHDFNHLKLMEDFSPKLPYYVDGIVLKVNDLEDQESLGHHGDDPVKPPRGSIAWKFKEEEAEATQTGWEWNASRTGRVVPTALFDEPFVLAETENRRATANNYGWAKEMGLGPGAVVKCKKGGKIIPNICGVVTKANKFDAPDNCPSCATKLQLHTSDSGNQDLLCKNQDCPAKHVKSWIHYIQMLGGKGLGLAAMEGILNSGKVKQLPDLYDLSLKDLTDTGDFSARQALLALACIHMVRPSKDDDKLEKAILKARGLKHKVPAWQFFAALGIPQAGRTAGKALIAHFGNFQSIIIAQASVLEKVDGIGTSTAEAVQAWFGENAGMVQELLDHVELELPKTGKLSGKNFVLTGDFDPNKKAFEKRIQDIGGNIQSSVGTKTDYLVAGDQTGKTKTDRANKLKVPIITVDELEKML